MPKKHHPVKKQWAKKNISFLSFSFSPLPPFLPLALSPTLPAPSLPLFLSLLPLDIDQLPDPQLHGQMDGFCIWGRFLGTPTRNSTSANVWGVGTKLSGGRGPFLFSPLSPVPFEFFFSSFTIKTKEETEGWGLEAEGRLCSRGHPEFKDMKGGASAWEEVPACWVNKAASPRENLTWCP